MAKAEDCKSSIPGSNPGAASILLLMKRFLIIIFSFLLILAGIAFSIGIGALYGIYRAIDEEIPDISIMTYKPRINTIIYDCNGKKLVELYSGENRTKRVRISDLPDYVGNAVIAIEDERFYKHFGVDPIALLRAAYVDYIKKKPVQGGSTITQQLAKNAFLTHKKTIRRKIKEMIVAFKIEKLFTKQQILESYLNQIYFGPRAYGIASAAKFYFNKEPEELTLLESAILAGIIKNPAYYSPFKNPKRALSRAKFVLKKMLNFGMINQYQYENALKEPLRLNTRRSKLPLAPFFIYEYLIPRLTKLFGEEKVFSGGLKIYTTIDSNIQRIAEEALKNANVFKDISDTGENHIDGAVVVLDTRTSKIRAMVGGRDYLKYKFNRAVDAKRQVGSAFKPFVFLTAFDKGILPNEIVMDIPKQYEIPQTGQIWEPHNYEDHYHGPTTLINALIGSYNIASIELLNKVGAKDVIKLAKKLGFKSYLGATMSLALGAYEVSPLEVASAYATVARLGIASEPFGIERVEDMDGTILLENEFRGKQVVSPESCYILIDILKKVIKYGTGWRARLNRPCGGKTGTTDNYTNAWFCGITPELVGIVYVGFDRPMPMGNNETGGHVAAPIWKRIMINSLKDRPVIDFQKPSDIVICDICKESGLLSTPQCPVKYKQAFRIGTEPKLKCNFHSLDMNFFNNKWDNEENNNLQPSNYPSFDEYLKMQGGH